MAARRFVKAGEYELFLDEDIYDAFLNGRYRRVYVLWYGWHRLWQPRRETSGLMRRGVLFRDQFGSVRLDLLLPECLEGLYTVKLVCSVRARDSISFVVKV